MKKITTLFALALTFFFTEVSSTQDFPNNKLILSGGMSQMARQDLIYSPFIHSDQSLMSFGIKYQRDNKYFQYLDLNFSYNTSQLGEPLEMEMGHHTHMMLPHEFLFVSGTYGVGKTLNDSPGYRDWAGGALKIDLQATFYNFILSNMFGYFFDQSANVWYRRAWLIGDKHRISAHTEVPVLSWLARPPYLAEDDEFIENISSHNSTKILLAFIEDGKLVTWNRYQRVNLFLEYSFPLSKRIHLGADYRFVFIHSRDPRPLLSFQNNVNVTSTFKF